MLLNPLKLRKSLNKAYLRLKPERRQIDGFKSNLDILFTQINEQESEEFHKNLISHFLKKTYYDPEYFINTKERSDLVIHTGISAKSTVGVIIETKKPTNKSEMLRIDNINTKAFHELILYYLRERVKYNNINLKYIVATNIYEWFIFDGSLFEKIFAQNKFLVKQFNDFELGRLGGKTTDFFYKNIAEPFVDKIEAEISFTHFNINDYRKAEKSKLIPLYKILSPEHLLKLPFENDSNTLDKKFYNELLHIIGLEEIKEKGKKLIRRKVESDRNFGSLLENTIVQLESKDKISRLNHPEHFGSNLQERLFGVGLELVITWVNRILFLKLLEAQLIKYHKGNRDYAFLNCKKIQNFDDLEYLFFNVLACNYSNRKGEALTLFKNVPYLNSSLFELTELEHATVEISNLRDDRYLPVFSNTVLKDPKGKKLSGELNTIEYLFKFLDAYDFSSEGSEEILEESKTLINASVLGLIFEKINGYKDGSFFTPGFITMYMCRETIRRAVVQRFNEENKWNCDSLVDVYNKIWTELKDFKKANEIINSLKICDPAVGSGHFLVSALNEIIAIKRELQILVDKDGKIITYDIEVENDELTITDIEGKLFEYNPSNKESQRVQETLFHEKQTIIENCLFGVDINHNSVKICRLRLWIELLKNAYYKGGTSELETLPNIDINIKCGNSLISRYPLDSDLKQALKKSKWSIDSYKSAVRMYQNAKSKEEKKAHEEMIKTIKSDFETEIAYNDPIIRSKKEYEKQLFILQEHPFLLNSESEKKDDLKKIKGILSKLKKIDQKLEKIKKSKIFKNAFEWRFEFPEVLNSEGDFIGFDVVIGNPPYMSIQELKKQSNNVCQYYSKNYYTANKGNFDIYLPFIEKSYELLKNNGCLDFILPTLWIYNEYGKNLRDFILNRKCLSRFLNFGSSQVFADATIYTGCQQFIKSERSSFLYGKTTTSEFPHFETFKIEYNNLSADSWCLVNKQTCNLKNKLEANAIPLGDLADIFVGIQTSADIVYHLIRSCTKSFSRLASN